MGGILGGLIGPALNVATQAAGAYEQGEAQANQQKQAQIVQALQLKRQQEDDALKRAVANANIQHLGAETQKLGAPAPKHYAPVTGTNAQGDNEVYRFDSGTGEVAPTGVSAKSPTPPQAPVPHYSIQNVTGADGQIHLARVNSLTGEVTELPNLGRQPSSSGGGGSGSGAQVPVADMQQRYSEIEGAARDLAAGKWKMTPAMQTREGFDYAVGRETAAGHPSLSHTAASLAMNGLALGGGDYQHYQALMNSSRALGDDVAKVFKGRQNEEAVNREVQLGRLTPDDYQNPQVVEQKLSRLRHIIDLAQLNNPAQSALTGTPKSRSSVAPNANLPDRDLWEQYVKQGMTPAQATAKVLARHQ